MKNEIPKLPRFDRNHPLVSVDPTTVSQIEDCANNGQFMDGHALLQELPSPVFWEQSDARLSGSFIIGRLGGDRLSDLIDITTYRRHAEDSRAIIRMNHIWADRKGAFAAYCKLREVDPLQYEGEDRARIYRALCWRSLAFNDVAQAEALVDLAYEADPADERHWYAKACISHADEQYERTLEESQRALEADALYLPARHLMATAYERLEKPELMESVLREGLKLHQDGQLAIRLLRFVRELDRHEEALELAQQVDAWMPLQDKNFTQWLHGEYADVYYDLGRYEEAREHAAQGNEHYYQKFAERLGAMSAPPRKKRLPVASVRQLRRTCGPATLASIARYWGQAVEQSAIIEEIWHDGTFDWKERRWAEDQGFVVREFRVTWESAQQLIDAGYPFAVMTAGADFSHLQAIIGYDALRECVEVREPGSFTHVDYIQEKFFENNAWVGPRGLVFAPPEEADALRALELPDEALYDLCYALNRALEQHDRGRAVQLFAQLEEQAPESFLTHSASRLLANYDADTPRGLAAVRALRKEFPDATRLQLSELYYMQNECSWAERVEFLQALTKGEEVHPTVRMELGRLLMDDVRRSAEAEKVLWKCHSEHHGSSAVMQSLADLLWGRRARETAFHAYRFAFTQDYLHEGRARSFFQAARFFKRGEEALELLKQRVERHGNSSGEPAVTLADMLRLLDRDGEAMSVLEDAVAKRPDDADLLASFASRCIDRNQLDRAAQLLDRAKGKIHEIGWLELSARLASTRGDHEDALKLYADAVSRDERNVNLQRAYLATMHRIDGKQQVIDYLDELCERFPYHNDLNELFISWLKETDHVKGEAVCRRLLEFHPNNHWARRELAIALEFQGKIADAIVVAEEARDKDRLASSSYNVLGDLYEKDARFADAMGAFRHAIELEADNRFAIGRLGDLAINLGQAPETVEFVWEQIKTQTLFGDGILEFRAYARQILPPEDVLARLEDALSEREDFWHCHAALCYQLIDMGRLDEALAAAERCCERFPLVPGSFGNLARIASVQGNATREIEALEKALEINPHWVDMVEHLADAYNTAHRGDDELALLERSLRLMPTAHTLYGYLAAWHARRGNTQAAIEQVEKALSLEPTYQYGWSSLNDWGAHDECVRKARELTEERPGQANTWQMLANVLNREEDRAEREKALQQALELEPWNMNIVDDLAMHFAEVGDYERAMAVATPETHRDAMPYNMIGRQAWVLWESGKRTEAIAKMREVVTQNPSYWWGTSRLAEWLSTDKRGEEALEVAQAMTARWPNNYVSWGYLGKVRGELDQTEEAVAALKQALTMEPNYSWGWDTLESYAKAEETEALALEMAERCPGESRPWMMLARAMDEQNRINECLEAIDQALLRDARLTDAIDYKAVLLTRAGKFDEAREACVPPAFGEDTPFNLLGRRAWVLAQEGKLEDALKEMREIWNNYPNYYWGGERVLEWLRELERWGDLSRESNVFFERFPDDSVGKGYGAIAAQEKEAYGEAKRLLREALEIDEDYTFAANRLFFLHFDSEETVKAEEVANRFSDALGEARGMLFQALIETQRKRWKDLKQQLPKLAVEEDIPQEHLRYLYDAMRRRSKGGMLIKAFSRRATEGDISEPALRLLIEVKVELKQLGLASLIEPQSEALQTAAMQALFYHVNDSNLTYRQFRRLFKKFKDLAERDGVAWGNIGQCFVGHRRYRDAVAWMSNWREREIELWMLNNLLFAYVALKDWQSADELAQAQIQNRSIQFGSDHPFGYLAFRCAQAGNVDQAKALQRCMSDPDSDFFRCLTWTGANALIAVHGEGSRKEKRSQARPMLKELFDISADHRWSRDEAANMMSLLLDSLKQLEPKTRSVFDGYYPAMIRFRSFLKKINYTG
ncbi:C39 family peptidase [Cerasicoccus frondis]|uniref:C39 family peptidase n=1 Tax=Cerasicoccus frondis TaxID=490090 RepID=UPI00285268E4|nr:C39 family peptidase [Cerasicoccus frondis]